MYICMVHIELLLKCYYYMIFNLFMLILNYLYTYMFIHSSIEIYKRICIIDRKVFNIADKLIDK
jgi:hypothetical protein